MAPGDTELHLTAEQARRLLAPIGPVAVTEVAVMPSSNDVFKVTTRAHGNYYVKFHTARWYADQPDTFFVVERECAVCELLRKRGLALPGRAWGDFTRTVVPRSVFLCEELPGTAVPEALTRYPDERGPILEALGRYTARLHSIEFATPGLIACAHAYFAPAEGVVPPVPSWDGHPMHHARHLQRDALSILTKQTPHLPAPAAASLRQAFSSLADTVRADYVPLRFTVGNCHAWHFHVSRRSTKWCVEGFYDYEAASAGDATIDLVELEATLTPALGSASWRQPFFDGYGHRPSFEGYKWRLLYYLLIEVGKPASRMIPDPAWLRRQWPGLIEARDWPALEWYPTRDG